MMTRLLILLLMVGLVPTSALRAAILSPDDWTTLRQVEAYLNQITSLRAPFLQVASTGEVARGTISMVRPGRLRIDYDPPADAFLVVNYGDIAFIDGELESISILPVEDTPLAFLLQETIAFSGDVTPVAVSKAQGLVRVDLIQTEDPEAGRVSIILDSEPYALRQWVVEDAQGTRTMISLRDPKFGIPVNDALFSFNRKVWRDSFKD